MVKTGGCVCLLARAGCVAALLLSVGTGACVLVRGLRGCSKRKERAGYSSSYLDAPTSLDDLVWVCKECFCTGMSKVLFQ